MSIYSYFLTSFLASKLYKNTFTKNLIKGSVSFSIYSLMNGLFSILKIYRILLNFHSLHTIYIDPYQLYVINSIKGLLFVC